MDLVKLQDVLSNFKAVFFDSYGVLKNHKGSIEGAQRTLDYLKDRAIPFRVLTNDASRSPQAQSQRFRNIGVSGIEPAHIVTSGMMAKQYLECKVKEGLIGYIGTREAANSIISGPNLQALPIDEIAFERASELKAIVFLDDEGYDWRTTINHVINLLRKVNIPVIIANTDRIYPVSNNDVSLATGGIALLVQSIVRREFINFGKPDTQMFGFAFDDIVSSGYALNRDEVLMIGDTLHTDILGGNKFGTSTALVLTGNTTYKNAQLLIDSTGVCPDYVFASISID